MVTESRAHGHAESSGASPTVWAIFFSSLAVSIALVLEGSVRIEPDWARWWAVILGLEVSAYTLTLFLPPFTRVNLLHALCRVGVGMLMRLFVVALCTLLLVVGGEANLLGGLKLFWAAHWPSAIGQIVCVAVAVYCFRVIAMRRSTTARQPVEAAAAAPVATRSADELLEELMSDRESFESADASPSVAAGPAPPQPQPAPPPIQDQKAEQTWPPMGAARLSEPLTPVADVESPDQDVADIVEEPRTAAETLAPPGAIRGPETSVEGSAPREVVAQVAEDEDWDEPPYVATRPFPAAPVQEWPTTPPPEAPPEPPPADPPAAAVESGPARLPTALGLTAAKAGRAQASPGPGMAAIPRPETSAPRLPLTPAAPTPRPGVVSAGSPIEPAVTDRAEPPLPVADVEAEAAPQEPVTTEAGAYPVAEPARPAVPLSDPSTSGALELPAEVVLGALPADLLDRPIEEVAEKVPEGMFSFEWEAIAPQLERGQVRVSGQALLGQMPRDTLATSAGDFLTSLPPEGLELPLAEIVMRLPADFFGPPPDQIALEPIADEPPIFEEGSPRPIGEPSGAGPKAAQPPLPAPSPEPTRPTAHVPQPVVESARPADTVSRPPQAEEEEEPSGTYETTPRAATGPALAPPEPWPTPAAVEEPPPVAETATPAAAVSRPPQVEEEEEPSETDETTPPPATGPALAPPEPWPTPAAVEEPPPVAETATPAAAVSRPPQVEEEEEPSETDETTPRAATEPALSPPEPWPTPAAASRADMPDGREDVVGASQPGAGHETPLHSEERVISSAIAALQRRHEAEEASEPPDTAPKASEPTTAFQAGRPSPPEGTVSEEAELAEAAVGDQPMPAHQEAIAPDEPQPEPPSAVAAEAPPAQTEEGAVPPDTPAAPAPEPAAEPAASSPVAPQLEAELRNALEVLGCKGIDMIRANGVSVVVAHSAPHATSELAASLAELVKATRRIVAETGAGAFRSALLIGTRGTTFVGSPGNAQAPHLVVATDNAGAGHTTVAARKAVALLESVETAHEPGADEPSSLTPARLPGEDHALAKIAAVIGQRAGAFRSDDGFGVVALGLEREPRAGTAAAAETVWRAAQAAQPSGVDRLLVMGSSRALGLAMADEADALVVAGFAAGMSPGLVATEAAKLARTCNDLAQREGMPTDVG